MTAYDVAKERLEKKFGCKRRQLSIHFEDLAVIYIDSNTPDSCDSQNSNYVDPSAGHVIT